MVFWPLLLMHLLVAGVLAEESSPNPAVAAKVNGVIISRQDFQRELDRITRQKGTAANTTDESRLADLKREALENLIIRELLYQECTNQRITIDALVVDREMEQVKSKFATPGQFAESLKHINMTEALVREQVARGLAIKILIDRSVGKSVTVSDEEIKKYYEQHQETFTQQPQAHLSHILVEVDAENKKKEARAKISSLRKRIVDGEDFVALAAAHSDCQSKTKGGDIGWFTPGQLTPEMEKSVSLLKLGELSEIVEDKFGMHIIKVVERKEGFTSPLSDVGEKVRSLLRQENSLTMLQRYVKSLRDAAKVEIHLTEG
jgi:parvulin-like peptidyl-prolyl isomerase